MKNKFRPVLKSNPSAPDGQGIKNGHKKATVESSKGKVKTLGARLKRKRSLEDLMSFDEPLSTPLPKTIASYPQESEEVHQNQEVTESKDGASENLSIAEHAAFREEHLRSDTKEPNLRGPANKMIPVLPACSQARGSNDGGVLPKKHLSQNPLSNEEEVLGATEFIKASRELEIVKVNQTSANTRTESDSSPSSPSQYVDSDDDEFILGVNLLEEKHKLQNQKHTKNPSRTTTERFSTQVKIPDTQEVLSPKSRHYMAMENTHDEKRDQNPSHRSDTQLDKEESMVHEVLTCIGSLDGIQLGKDNKMSSPKKECPYGSNCERTSKRHFEDYVHPPDCIGMKQALSDPNMLPTEEELVSLFYSEPYPDVSSIVCDKLRAASSFQMFKKRFPLVDGYQVFGLSTANEHPLQPLKPFLEKNCAMSDFNENEDSEKLIESACSLAELQYQMNQRDDDPLFLNIVSNRGAIVANNRFFLLRGRKLLDMTSVEFGEYLREKKSQRVLGISNSLLIFHESRLAAHKSFDHFKTKSGFTALCLPHDNMNVQLRWKIARASKRVGDMLNY